MMGKITNSSRSDFNDANFSSSRHFLSSLCLSCIWNHKQYHSLTQVESGQEDVIPSTERFQPTCVPYSPSYEYTYSPCLTGYWFDSQKNVSVIPEKQEKDTKIWRGLKKTSNYLGVHIMCHPHAHIHQFNVQLAIKFGFLRKIET